MGDHYKFSGLIPRSGNFSIQARSHCGAIERALVLLGFDPVLFSGVGVLSVRPTPQQSASAARRDDNFLGRISCEFEIYSKFV